MIDTLIIGGGAAGLYLASFHPRSVILERGDECGRKLLLTGGGRCNYTNTAGPEEMALLFNGNKAFIRKVLYAHTSKDIIAHFRTLGITPAEEDRGRIFPKGGDAKAIRDALLKSNPRIIHGKAESIRKEGDAFIIETGRGRIEARRVVIATGGDSFPQTGSDGSGYRLCRQLGHTISQPYPALAPIALIPSLSTAEGVSATVSIKAGKARSEGDIIITRLGISGPAALDISRHLSPDDEIEICFMRISKETLRMSSGGKTVKNALSIPPRLSEALLGSLADKRCASLSRQELDRIESQLSRFKAKAKAIRAGAMNTKGGVSASEIDPRTMGSKLVEGLYFAGDIIDVDGPTGGYSLSFAFASAYIIHKALESVCL